MAGAVGIEPTLKVLETLVLPLNYAPKVVEGDGFEPPNPEGADLQSAAFSHFATPPHIRIKKNGGGRGIRTPARFNPPVGFQDRSLQPDLGIPPFFTKSIW